MDLTTAIVIVSSSLAPAESMASDLLLDAVDQRSGIRWATTFNWTENSDTRIWLGTEADLHELPQSLATEISKTDPPNKAEGYRIVALPHSNPPSVLVVGHDRRGALYGTGKLLRAMSLSPGRILVPDNLSISTSPRYELRGHQLGYRPSPNSYDAWDLAQWEQYYRDLIVFGANAIEILPPRTKPSLNSSPHYPLPPLEMMTGMSRLADQYELDVWAWYPAVIGDYEDPRVVAQHLQETETFLESIPRLDHLFVPGGDPGYTKPSVLIPLLEKKKALLERFHPNAGLWVSPQGFGKDWLDELLDYIEDSEPEWLTGIVFGPGVRITLKELRGRLPSAYPIRSYPDITHTFHCQYPVPSWDRAFALTEGREPINPRPIDQSKLFHFEKNEVIGWLTYSEGCNDDVNKAIWSALAWDPDAELIDILRDYGRHFIGPQFADAFAQGLFALERNWRGPILANQEIITTLHQFKNIERNAGDELANNWRFHMALYRAYYDAYLYKRQNRENAAEALAMEALSQAASTGSRQAMYSAQSILQKSLRPDAKDAWRKRIFEIGDNLFENIGMQLSVEKHQASSVNRGANLDMVDFPLSNAPWILARFSEIRALETEAKRLTKLREIVNWTHPGPGGFYDDLGDANRSPHLVRGGGFDTDPGVLRSPADDFELIKEPPFYKINPYRASWLNRASTLHGTPLRMRYPNLDPKARYNVRIVYPADRDDFVPKIRLATDDGFEIHSFIDRPIPAKPIELHIPRAATKDGFLELNLMREVTQHGNGRGAQIAEIWLIRTPDGPPSTSN